MQRATVAEVDRMIAGALWRSARQWDLLAWQTAHLLNAQGAKTEDGQAWTAEDLLHRPIVLGDPRTAEAPPDKKEGADSVLSEKTERGLAMIQDATMQKAMRRLPRPPVTH